MLALISLINGWLPTLIVALGLGSVVLAFDWFNPAWKRQLLIGVPVTLAIVGLAALGDDGLALVPYQFPNSYYFWVGLVVLAIAICIIGWRAAHPWRRVVSLLSILLTFAMALTLINENYQYYPTVRSLLGYVAADQVSLPQLDAIRAETRKTGHLPAEGFTLSIAIPGELSGFHARDAYVYLPPVWFRTPRPSLPVIELIQGTPGYPYDWTRGARADRTSNAFADEHRGTSPILVMPDPNGSFTGDTECVNSHLGHVGTYLTKDVPAFARKEFGAASGPNSLAVAGLSAGGTCSIMLAVRNPTIYQTFGDYSGYQAPSIGEGLDVVETVKGLFDGNRGDYDAHDPRLILKDKRFPGMAGWFEVGGQDSEADIAQKVMAPLARRAGIDTCVRVVPGGGHDFDTWEQAFKDSLPWLSWRLNLTPKPRTMSAVCRQGAR